MTIITLSTESIIEANNVLKASLLKLTHYIDSKFDKWSPSSFLLATTVSVIALHYIVQFSRAKWGETRREQIGRMVLLLPLIRKKYERDIALQRSHFRGSVQKKWKDFSPLVSTLPEKGWDQKKLIALIDQFSNATLTPLIGKYLSGTVYSHSLIAKKNPHGKCLKTFLETHLDSCSGDFETVFTLAFQQSHLWNSLHGDEFAIGSYIDHYIVRIIADMFGAHPDEVMGFVTSGGTESLMVAVRAYREWGIKNRGHAAGEGVIIASKSVHAAILKAGQAYLVKVELVETDKEGRVKMDALRKAVRKHGNAVIAIIGSTPSYPIGVIDPIEEMAEIAKEAGCGFHIDCCLGAFIINNLPRHNTSYLKMPGVTSLSADTHKNGLAPKGSSVLITKNIESRNLAYYSIYSVPEWNGGVYGTPKDAGSQSCVSSLTTLLALLGTGKNGYKEIAEVHATTLKLAEIIRLAKGKLKLIAEPQVNVVAFEIDDAWCLQKGAIYAFSHEMARRNCVLNNLADNKVHFCVTLRFAQDQAALGQFQKAVNESLNAVEELNNKLLERGEAFSGDAGIYCALGAAMQPTIKDLSIKKYVENFLFGIQGAKDTVRAYFLAQFNPMV